MRLINNTGVLAVVAVLVLCDGALVEGGALVPVGTSAAGTVSTSAPGSTPVYAVGATSGLQVDATRPSFLIGLQVGAAVPNTPPSITSITITVYRIVGGNLTSYSLTATLFGGGAITYPVAGTGPAVSLSIQADTSGLPSGGLLASDKVEIILNVNDAATTPYTVTDPAQYNFTC